VAEFAAHATARRGSTVTDRREAWARVFLKDGRSLSQCLVELMRRDVGVVAARNGGVRVKEKCSDPEGDSVCSICNDGGELLLCDNCVPPRLRWPAGHSGGRLVLSIVQMRRVRRQRLRSRYRRWAHGQDHHLLRAMRAWM